MKKAQVKQNILNVYLSLDKFCKELGNDKLPRLTKGEKIVLRSALIMLDNIASEAKIKL